MVLCFSNGQQGLLFLAVVSSAIAVSVFEGAATSQGTGRRAVLSFGNGSGIANGQLQGCRRARDAWQLLYAIQAREADDHEGRQALFGGGPATVAQLEGGCICTCRQGEGATRTGAVECFEIIRPCRQTRNGPLPVKIASTVQRSVSASNGGQGRLLTFSPLRRCGAEAESVRRRHYTVLGP